MPRPARSKPAPSPKTVNPRPLAYPSPGDNLPASPRLDDPRLWSALIILITCLAYCPLFTSDFTNVDDPETIARNPLVNPPTLTSLLEFWDPRKPRMDLYVPVTYTVWSAVARLAWVPTPDAAGIHLNSWMFHGTNVVLHALSALVTFHLLRMLLMMRPQHGGSAPRTDSVSTSPTTDCNDPNARLAAPITGRGPLATHDVAPRLSGDSPKVNIPAFLGALLSALHPVQVEPVGWASGTKDILHGLLAMIAILGYLRSISSSTSAESPFRSPWYWLATLAFLLAMLSKPTAIVTPLIAAALDFLVLRRRFRDVVGALWPWLLLTVPVIIEGRLVQPAHHASDFAVPVRLRPLIAADALAFDFFKLLWPSNLGVMYNRSPQAVIAHGWLWWTWIFPAAAALAAGGALLIRFRGSEPSREGASGDQPAIPTGAGSMRVNSTGDFRHSLSPTVPLAALAIFVICVLPVLGLVPFDFQQFSTTADHYLYLAMLGPALGLAFLLDWCARLHAHAEPTRPGGPAAEQSISTPHRFAILLCAVLLAALGTRTMFQTLYWHDSFTLLRHSIAVNPESPYLYDNLSKAYADENRPDDARQWDEESVRRWPARAGGHLNLAADLLALNRLAEAEDQLVETLRLDATCLPARDQLARLRRGRGTTNP